MVSSLSPPQEYGCRIEYDTTVRVFSEWLPNPRVYHLPEFPTQNISVKVLTLPLLLNIESKCVDSLIIGQISFGLENIN